MTRVSLPRKSLPDDEEFLRAVWNRLVNFAWHQLHDGHAAEDMAQETLIHYLRRRREIRTGSESAWLFSTCRNLCRNLQRKKTAVLIGHDDPGIADRSGQHAARLDLARALETLPEEQRDLFLLRTLGGLTIPELANITGIPEGTVKSRLFHITMKLRPRLRGYEEAVGG